MDAAAYTTYEIDEVNHVIVNNAVDKSIDDKSSDKNVKIHNQIPEKEECIELRNIKYKSMLLKKTNIKQLTKCNSTIDIDSFLEKERTQNKEDQWTKLDKSMKISKVTTFVETYSSENNLNEKDKLFLNEFLLYCIEQKKLTKTKDVVYDRMNGVITSIPCLVYTPTLNKKFTLKRCEKRPSTLSSLAPKNKASRKSSHLKSSENKNTICETV
jgi:hypothetical protein